MSVRIVHCEACGDELWPRRIDARYCGGACRVRAHRERARAASLRGGAGRKGLSGAGIVNQLDRRS